jgi:hypothetical protein
MQLALRPYAIAGVVVVGAGLICVTPLAAPHIEQRTVHLAAIETLIDPVGPLDAAASSLGGVDGSLFDSVAGALAPEGGALSSELSGVLPSLADLSGTFADAADSTGTDFWSQVEAFFGGTFLIGLIVFGDIVGVLETLWNTLLGDLGIQPASALTAAATEALDPSVLASVLDFNPWADIGTAFDSAALADLGTAFDPAVLADIGQVLTTSAVPDVGAVLASLIP